MFRVFIQSLLLTLATSAAITCAATSMPAAAPSTQPAVDVIRLSFPPVATSQPALQYPLLPPVVDQHPGNGASLYMVAAANFPRYPRTDDHHDPEWKVWDQLDEQLHTPIQKFSLPVASNVADRFWKTPIEMAARRERADWDVDLHDEGINGLLPHLNYTRTIADATALRVRIALARGHFAEASDEMQTGCSLAHQLNEQPVLVQALVSAGIARLMLDVGLADWIARGGPNLYWSLSDLPAPFIDVAAVAANEQAILPETDPIVRRSLDGTLPADQWRDAIAKWFQISTMFTNHPLTPGLLLESEKKLVADNVAAARDWFARTGHSVKESDSMSNDQLVGEFLAAEYRRVSEDTWKAWPLSFPAGVKAIQDAQHDSERLQQAHGSPLLGMHWDHLHLLRSRASLTQLDQDIAAWRIVEAIRDDAAKHGGTLPDRLEDITDLPIPNDPMTEKPFVFHRDGSTAELDCAPYEPSAIRRQFLLTVIK